jgi:hypothetical protein
VFTDTWRGDDARAIFARVYEARFRSKQIDVKG